MKKLISKRKLNAYKKKGMKLLKKNAIPSALIAGLLVGVAAYKKPVEAYYDDGSAGRGALFGGLTGAAIGGAAGGGKGAAIGGFTGLALGGLIGGARSRGRDPYRQLDRLERRLGRLEDKAVEYRNLMKSASSERRRQRYSRRLARVESDISSKKREISRIKQNLGVRK